MTYELHQHLECLVIVFVLFGLSYHAILFDIVVIYVVGFKYYFNNNA